MPQVEKEIHAMKLEKVTKVCLKLKEKGFNFHTTPQHKNPKSKHNHYAYGNVRLNYVLHHPNGSYVSVFREQANGEYITDLF
jgi:hypothetical protein